MLRVSAFEADSVSAECAVVLNLHTDEVFFEKNAQKRHSMASTTKIMTSLLAIESGKLQSEIIVSGEMLKVEGTSMGLVENDSVSLEELVYGMMLASGNDAANATAIFLGGTLDDFSVLMNERAKEIGMNNTNFVTPSGLDSENHYSTAYDMALLGASAVKNPKFLSVCSSRSASLSYGNPPYLRTIYNHNKLLDRYDYALGVKTGFTKKSGRCLVSYAKRDFSELIAVTLNAPDDWDDHVLMLDEAFRNLSSAELIADVPVEIPVVGGISECVSVSVEPYVYSYFQKAETFYKVYLEKFLYAPVEQGTVTGYCEYYVNGSLRSVEPIIAQESVSQKV